VDEVSEYCFENPAEFTPEHARQIDVVLEFLRLDLLPKEIDAANLFLLFQQDWGGLNAEQKSRLLEIIDFKFDRYPDFLAYHVQAELLGRFFRSIEAADVIEKLVERLSGTARQFLPLACEELIKANDDISLRRRMFKVLVRLRSDDDGCVRNEAEESFRRLLSNGVSLD